MAGRHRLRGLTKNFYVSCGLYISIGGVVGAAYGAGVQTSREAPAVSETVVIEVTPTPAPVSVIPQSQASGPFPTQVPTARPTPRATVALPSPAPDRSPQSSPFVFARR